MQKYLLTSITDPLKQDYIAGQRIKVFEYLYNNRVPVEIHVGTINDRKVHIKACSMSEDAGEIFTTDWLIYTHMLTPYHEDDHLLLEQL